MLVFLVLLAYHALSDVLVHRQKIRYTKSMYNWSVDESVLAADKTAHTKWRLEQLINFGLNTEKINEQELKTHWSDLALDPSRRRFLDFLLHG